MVRAAASGPRVALPVVVRARPHQHHTSQVPSLKLWGKTGTVRVAWIANGSIGGETVSLVIRAPRVLARDHQNYPPT